LIPKVRVKSVLNKHKRWDSWFLDDYSVNPYYGCQFACIYCYTRGGSYGREPHRLAAKVNAPEVLDRQLRRRASRKEYGFIALGTSTEPYMEVERKLEITRKVLSVISHYRFPVHVLTKSTLVTRDSDLLAEIAGKAVLPPDLEGRVSGALVTISMSTIDDELAKFLEPGAPSPSERFEALERLRDEGIGAGVAFIPVIPSLSDGEDELRRAIREARKRRASYVFVGALTLPGSLKRTFLGVVRSRFPDSVYRYRRIFRGSYPSKEYQDRLYSTAIAICREEGVRLGILEGIAP